MIGEYMVAMEGICSDWRVHGGYGGHTSIYKADKGDYSIKVSGVDHSTIVRGGVVAEYMPYKPIRRLLYTRWLHHVGGRRHALTSC